MPPRLRMEIRDWGLRTVGLQQKSNHLRILKMLKITCQEVTFQEFLEASETLTDPLLVCYILFQELKTQIKAVSLTWEYPCHTQAAESMNNCVTKAIGS